VKRLALLCALAGCSVLPSPRAPTHDFIVLDPVDAAAPAARAATTAAVAIDRVRMPGYLERPEVVTRVSDHQIAFSPRERWGETLAEAVPRVLAIDLAAALAGDGIVVVDRGDGTAQRLVDVVILRFERTSAGRAELHARWTVRVAAGDTIGGGELRTGEVMPPAPAGAVAGAASAESLSRLLGQLGARIADDVRTPAAPTAAAP
jgi:uncharacterized protein